MIQRRRIYHLRPGELVLQLGDPARDQPLLFLGGVVLRVFREIAVAPRLLDILDVPGTLHRLDPLQILLEFPIT